MIGKILTPKDLENIYQNHDLDETVEVLFLKNGQ